MNTSKKSDRMKRHAALLLATIVAVSLLSGGTALALTRTCETNVDCFGTRKPDTLKGSVGNDFIYGRGGDDTLRGIEFSDFLFGQGGPDSLFGGPDPDTLIGGPGDDGLAGGGGMDFYHFGNGWGKDSISEGANSANVVIFTNSPGEEVPVTEDLTVRLISGDGPEVKTEDGSGTIEWEVGAIRHVLAGTGSDRITGNSADNDIYGVSGADTIFGGGGDDEIRVRDGSGGDVVDCGEAFIGSDEDTVYFDDGDQIDPNCENEISAP